MGFVHIRPVSHPHRDHDPGHLIGQGPVEQPAGDELLVGYQQLLAVPVADGGGTNLDSGHGAIGVADRDEVANPDRTLEQDDQATDEVGHNLLQSKTDAHTQRGHQPLKLGPLRPDGIEHKQDAGGNDGIGAEGRDCVAAAR